ncbi:hypothetical protein HW115_07240 [Verrucomicrobiaceae bacterium N1E253]|uniref:Gingipain domain-containing protein n=1 Tax=Oceaniferula marina TaxID=2748318 RepID=A0A851GKZ8_9BACT|nr:C25 family cysteine peptidase [Oceaniferula marina]NWK55400.1 hypothetical protein [Oceaniferula marina]
MAIDIHCPHCGNTFSIPNEYLGRKGQCDQCDTKFIMDAPQHRDATQLPPSAPAPSPAPAPTQPSSSRPRFNSTLVAGFILIAATIAGTGYLALQQGGQNNTAKPAQTHPSADTETSASENKMESRNTTPNTITSDNPITPPETDHPKQSNIKPNQSKKSPSLLQAQTNTYHYYPVFASDTHKGEAPHSLYKGPRLRPQELENISERALVSSPHYNIHKATSFTDATILPIDPSQGRYLHLNLLNNFSTDPKKTGHCHIHEIYLADEQGHLIASDRFQLINSDKLNTHYGGEGPAHIIDRNNNTNWHSSLEQTFPYAFGIDCQQSITPRYLVFLHRGGRNRDYFVKELELQLSGASQPAPDKWKRYNTSKHHFQPSSIRNHTPAHADAAGLISIPHYQSVSQRGRLIFPVYNHSEQRYAIMLRSKDGSRQINGQFQAPQYLETIHDGVISTQLTLTPGVHQLSIIAKKETLDNILAVDLVPSSHADHYSPDPAQDPVTIYTPDYDELHPDILKKMLTLADGHYDIRTRIPDAIKSGRNGYLIITSEKKKQSLSQLDAFIRHKRSRGFDMHVITEKDFGGGTGRKAAYNIRNWLVENHKQYNTLYVLMLGNPHPIEGDTPYKKVAMWGALWKEISEIGVEEFRKRHPEKDEWDGYAPTDFFYADLTSNWDKNNNGVLADDGDYGEGGIDGQAEVYVGRIPFYGIDAKHGNARDVDDILRRVIRYENDAGDLFWRRDMFYAGEGTFDRTQNMMQNFLQHSGATMLRHAHHEDSIFEADVDHYRQHASIETQNQGKFGFIYYQEHASPYGIGAMSSNGTEQLVEKYPAVFCLGGCDVASPEHPYNLCYALLRKNGVAVFGGTRSVTGCNGNRWNKHNDYYSRLHFGMSTGETLWTMRSDQAKDNHIGGTNFMINLLGDPSVVIMPQLRGPELSVSPAFQYNLSLVQGAKKLLEIRYEIQNNTPQTQKYNLHADSGLQLSSQQITLEPKQYKAFTARIQSPEKLLTGDNLFTLTIKSNKLETKRTIRVKVAPRELVFYQNFNSPIKWEGVETQPATEEKITKGKFGSAAKFEQYGIRINSKRFANRKDYTICYHQNILKAGRHDVIQTGNISILLDGDTLKVWKHPGGWNYLGNPGAKIYNGPKVKFGQWQFIAVTYSHASKTLNIQVDRKSETHQLDIDDLANFTSNRIMVTPRNNRFAIDDLHVFNFATSGSERSLIAKQEFATPTLPLENAKVHPKQITLTWSNHSTRTREVEVATDPAFRNVVFKRAARHGTKVGSLKDHTRYFWRVRHTHATPITPATMVRSFTTDSNVKPIDFATREIKLRDAKVGVSGYNQRLLGFITGLDHETARKLTFTKVAGPGWLRIYPDGLLFTNYGATDRNLGNNTFQVLITAPDGTSHSAKFNIKVVR